MAGNKRTRGLDIATRDSLSALDIALAATEGEGMRPDEFTVNDYMAERKKREPDVTRDQCKFQLFKLVNSGVLKCRKIKIGSHRCNVFSKA